ncbi:hypothetical protein A1F94_011083 [Pyrenophora tritici-repentis]|nr:hypothetical protein A1F94_011083 [Pyrenophora tritici-repentis]
MNGNWHNVNGGGLPIRRPPPTVDEALPYSPFTSIIPFSPDIIPFPIAEPPTPPSTLSSDQQKAAKRAVAILNDEIQGQSTAQHLHDTLNQLRNLLSRDKLPEYHFKSMPQLATPPPDSPVKNANGDTSTYTPELSPFARMLLKQTDVPFTSTSFHRLCPISANMDSVKHQHAHASSQGASFCKATVSFATGSRRDPITSNVKRHRPRTKREPSISTQYSFIRS